MHFSGNTEKKPLSFWLLVAFAVCILLLIGFYTVENWRGKRAWSKYKAVLLAKGEKLDWKDFVPPPVPDEQNVLKVPIMEGWLYKTAPHTNNTRPLIRVPETSLLRGDWQKGQFTDLLDWKIYLREKRALSTNSAEGSTIGFRPDPNKDPEGYLRFIESHPPTSAIAEVIVVFEFNEIPLEDAIRNLGSLAFR